MMKNKTMYRSLAVLAVVAIAAFALAFQSKDQQYGFLAYALIMMYAVGIEVFVLLLMAVVFYFKRGDGSEADELWAKKQRKQYLLAALMVLLIGGSVCLGGTALLGA